MWVDKKYYWAWEGKQPTKVLSEDEIRIFTERGIADKVIHILPNGTKVIHINPPPPPSKKKLDFVTYAKGLKGEQKICIGVWDDDKYTPLNRDDKLGNLEWFLIPLTFDEELASHGYAKLVRRPSQGE